MIRLTPSAPVETKPVERITWSCMICRHPSNFNHYENCAECGSHRPSPPAAAKGKTMKGSFADA